MMGVGKMGKFTEADRARLIDAMCMTWRHDFGLDKEGRHELSSGMTEDERNALRRSMGQIFEHNISPLLAIPEGYALVPVEPTPEMLDVAVSFALNVTLSHENTWSAYMRDVWLRMTAASQQAAQ